MQILYLVITAFAVNCCFGAPQSRPKQPYNYQDPATASGAGTLHSQINTDVNPGQNNLQIPQGTTLLDGQQNQLPTQGESLFVDSSASGFRPVDNNQASQVDLEQNHFSIGVPLPDSPSASLSNVNIGSFPSGTLPDANIDALQQPNVFQPASQFQAPPSRNQQPQFDVRLQGGETGSPTAGENVFPGAQSNAVLNSGNTHFNDENNFGEAATNTLDSQIRDFSSGVSNQISAVVDPAQGQSFALSQPVGGIGQSTANNQLDQRQDNSPSEDFASAQYDFKWDVNDAESGNFYGHEENRNGVITRGRYYVTLPDTRIMTVEYYADETGFHPTVTFEGEAVYDEPTSNAISRNRVQGSAQNTKQQNLATGQVQQTAGAGVSQDPSSFQTQPKVGLQQTLGSQGELQQTGQQTQDFQGSFQQGALDTPHEFGFQDIGAQSAHDSLPDYDTALSDSLSSQSDSGFGVPLPFATGATSGQSQFANNVDNTIQPAQDINQHTDISQLNSVPIVSHTTNLQREDLDSAQIKGPQNLSHGDQTSVGVPLPVPGESSSSFDNKGIQQSLDNQANFEAHSNQQGTQHHSSQNSIASTISDQQGFQSSNTRQGAQGVNEQILQNLNNQQNLQGTSDQHNSQPFGINQQSFQPSGFDQQGFQSTGFNQQSFQPSGLIQQSFQSSGFDQSSFQPSGFNQQSFQPSGFDQQGFQPLGFDQQGGQPSGFDQQQSFQSSGFDQQSFQPSGFDQQSIQSSGFDQQGIQQPGLNQEILPSSGFSQQGFKPSGVDQQGIGAVNDLQNVHGNEGIQNLQPTGSFQENTHFANNQPIQQEFTNQGGFQTVDANLQNLQNLNGQQGFQNLNHQGLQTIDDNRVNNQVTGNTASNVRGVSQLYQTPFVNSNIRNQFPLGATSFDQGQQIGLSGGQLTTDNQNFPLSGDNQIFLTQPGLPLPDINSQVQGLDTVQQTDTAFQNNPQQEQLLVTDFGTPQQEVNSNNQIGGQDSSVFNNQIISNAQASGLGEERDSRRPFPQAPSQLYQTPGQS